jgi:hypothetical protein
MKRHATWIAAGLLTTALSTLASPADSLETPAVEFGRHEIDFKYGTARTGSDPRETVASIGYGWGVKEWWFTEIYLKYKRENNQGTFFDAIEWENKFQLTEPGQYPVDIGLLVEIERPRNHAEGWEVKWGPMFQKDIGQWQLNGNVFLERSYRAQEPSHTALLYQWQVKYRWKPAFEYGVQGFGELGQWDHWFPNSEQFHNLGPVVSSKFKLGDGHYVKYNAALLFKTSGNTPNKTFRLQAEYEF